MVYKILQQKTEWHAESLELCVDLIAKLGVIAEKVRLVSDCYIHQIQFDNYENSVWVFHAV